MKASKVIKKVIESDMPDMEAVQKKCVEELHKGKERHKKTNKRKSNRKIRKSIYAGLGVCAAIWLCALNLPASTGAESFIARLQTWLHLDHERVVVGEMEKNSIRIPEDCEEVESGGEKYLTKSYTSVEELERDIGKHLDIWRGIEEFEEGDIVLNILEEEYARITIMYDVSNIQVKDAEYADIGNQIRDLEYCITIPLSENFSMNNIKLKDQFLKNAVLDGQGNLISYGQSGEYSILETYYSTHLDIDISVIKKKKMENIDKEQDDVTDYHYYYLYFVYKGLSYQIHCHSNLDTAKSIVEELE